jgi:LPPG:FO 2-phospho-L-lactate transferase
VKKIVVVCGGIGGAKLVKGFYNNSDFDLTIVVNTGDDAFIHGVHLSPDLDSVIYALAGVEGEFGWGRKNDSYEANKIFSELMKGFDFQLGDMDLGVNLYRTQLLNEGKKLTEITHSISDFFGLSNNIYPMSDDAVRTKIATKDDGMLDFQEYFVLQKATPEIKEVIYLGSDNASVSEELVDKITSSELIVIAPSNPVLSIQPILSIKEYSIALRAHDNVVSVSPFIGNETIKGPAANNFKDLGFQSNSFGLMDYYNNKISKIIVNTGDKDTASGNEVIETNTVMKTYEDSIDLANFICEL